LQLACNPLGSESVSGKCGNQDDQGRGPVVLNAFILFHNTPAMKGPSMAPTGISRSLGIPCRRGGNAWSTTSKTSVCPVKIRARLVQSDSAPTLAVVSCLLLQTERLCRRHHPPTVGLTRSPQRRQPRKLTAPKKRRILEARIFSPDHAQPSNSSTLGAHSAFGCGLLRIHSSLSCRTWFCA
jgi:hypothetical protein